MTTYNTGNPLGSADPRDLYDNAENFDSAVNKTSGTWKDRLGRTRPTIASAIDPSGIVQQAADQAGIAEAAKEATLLALTQGVIGVYNSTTAGINDTNNGDLFWTKGLAADPRLKLWLNASGVAQEQFSMATAADFDKIRQGQILYTWNPSTSDRGPIYNFDFDALTLDVSRFATLLRGSVVIFDGASLTIAIDIRDQIVVLNIDTGAMRVRVASSGNILQENEYVICAFNQKEKRVYISDKSNMGDADRIKSINAEYFLSNNNAQRFLADFKFNQNKIEHNAFRVFIEERPPILVPAQTIDLPTDRVKALTRTVLINRDGLTLTDRVSTSISSDILKDNLILYTYSEFLGVVYTPYEYKINGTPFASNSDSGNVEKLPLKDSIIFNSSEPSSIVMVSDSHAEGDPVPLRGAFETTNISIGMVYGWFDQLVDDFPDYVEKEDLGFDESGQYPIYGYHFKPSPPDASEEFNSRTIPRVLIVAIHAETLNHVYIHVMMREICESWASNSRLAALRFGVEFYVIPCAHPYGIEMKSRLNVNGVDINRNFTYNWKYGGEGTASFSGVSAGSEQETKTIMGIVDTFKPHVAFDCHAFQGGESRVIWVPTITEQYRIATNTGALQTYQHAIKELPLMEGRSFNTFYYPTVTSPTGSHGLSSLYFTHKRAIGGTFEISRDSFGGTAYLTNTDINIGANMLMNSTYEALKVYINYGPPSI